MSIANSEIVFTAGEHTRPLIVKRHSNARGLRLRVDPRDGRVVLTIPKRGNLKKAKKWVETKRDWVQSEISKIPPPRPIIPGGKIPYRGQDVAIDWQAFRPRKPEFSDGVLLVGGAKSELQNRIFGWLKDRARETLQRETQFYADKARVTVGRVSIGGARTRWGSCSSSGGIRYSWRLIMAPPDVLSATVAHEVAHRVHMDHSPKFHALVAELFERDPEPERRWLREQGASLYRVGNSS